MSGAMRELGFDEASVDFSIDPEMYTKLDIKKAKIGEENEFDEQKIYNFQLAKDVTKLREKRGPFQERNHKFLELRGRDPFYQSIALKQGAGSRGDFRSLLPDTTDASWRATSQPFGRIAREKYMHWLANLPKGPSPEEILDKLQRARDKELWDQVLAGKTEPTKKELRAIDDARIAAMKVELQHVSERHHLKSPF
ncbi:hypothetical protein B484DRAFT_428836 [Ochromonadaceae sp. CCMP2298]|nr:hypothetical protein B484DRAFT_428836 [Ochromonadaceae sp. CCMP2298]